MGRSERRHWAKLYLQGLLLDGERKSIEPMAERLNGADVQAMRQFVGQSPWETESVQEPLAHWIVDHLHEPEVWMIDETSFPKAGHSSVGVTRQYCGALGKIANCQVAVSLHWSTAEASCPVAWKLYLPREWLEEARRAEGKIPPDVSYQSKNQLALQLIQQVEEWQLPRLPIVADSAYGNDFEFRQTLRQRQWHYAVAVEPTTKVWTNDPNAVPVPASQATGRPRRYPPPEAFAAPEDLLNLARRLPAADWKTLTWRQGTRGPQRSRFAKIKIWASHGWKAQEHPARAAEWLLIQWPLGEETPSHYWLAFLGEQPVGMARLVKTARARWRVELDYRELKEELGLDHYEGRHWLGWHHHVTLVSMAFAFLRGEQLRLKKNVWLDAATDTPAAAAAPH